MSRKVYFEEKIWNSNENVNVFWAINWNAVFTGFSGIFSAIFGIH